ncbi:putative ubiquitin-conjugating enzyme E2, partial [Gregarina niphandrodes]
MLTPSGRFVTNVSICFTMSDFHPETWNPAWNMVTVLLGIRSFMEAEPGTTGGFPSTSAAKQKFAKESTAYNSKDAVFKKLFPSLS